MMFERYTEKARRVIFYARYEASQYGSPYIEGEHFLLGILREDGRIAAMLPAGAVQSFRAQVDAQTKGLKKISTSVDLPLSMSSRRILAYSAEESDRLNQKHIGPEHLLLGAMREKDSWTVQLLEPFGMRLDFARKQVESMPPEAPVRTLASGLRNTSTEFPTVTIHGITWNLKVIRAAVSVCREYNWHWQKMAWKPRDIVIHRKTHKTSFDTGLASDSENFELVKGGWTKGRCAVCHWELFESKEGGKKDDARGIGYTNGHDWLCTECYDKFWDRPEFISGSYDEIT